MLTYNQLVKQPARLQAMTSLRPDEFEALLPFFAAAYAATQSADYTQAGQPRQRRAARAIPLAVQLDGTERPRLRPKNPAKQREYYSGKKKPTRSKTCS